MLSPCFFWNVVKTSSTEGRVLTPFPSLTAMFAPFTQLIAYQLVHDRLQFGLDPLLGLGVAVLQLVERDGQAEADFPRGSI